jgi:hypothetical protein
MREARRIGAVAKMGLLLARAEVNVKAASSSLLLGRLALFHIVLFRFDLEVLVLDVEP